MHRPNAVFKTGSSWIHAITAACFALGAAGCASSSSSRPRVTEVAVDGSQSPKDAAPASDAKGVATTGAKVTVKGPDELVGATLGAPLSSLRAAPDPHPPGTLVQVRGVSWYAPAAVREKIGDVPVSEVHYAFAKDTLITIQVMAQGPSACSGIRAAMESRYGKPPQKSEMTYFTTLTWGGDHELTYKVVHASKDPERETCTASLSDEPAWTAALTNQPPLPESKGLDHFGDAKLGSKASSFRGLRDKQRDGAATWYSAPSPSYARIPLKKLTYKFDGDRLVNVSFDVGQVSDCPRVLSSLKNDYGAAEPRANLGRGNSYDWQAPNARLTFNVFPNQCGGILYAQ